MTGTPKPLLGINHVALEVEDIDGALAFYGRYFDFSLRGRTEGAAFIDMGDQFLALVQREGRAADAARHVGLVVTDRAGLRRRMLGDGVTFVSDERFDFLDPWGNRIELVAYPDIQFLKTPEVMQHLGCGDLRKTDDALEQLREKGITPPEAG